MRNSAKNKRQAKLYSSLEMEKNFGEETWLSGGANLLNGRSVIQTEPDHFDCFCLDIGNLTASQSPCFLRVAWQLDTERILQLNVHGLSLNKKGRVYQATVRAALLYGCETWPIRAADLRRLQGARWLEWLESEFTDRKVRGSNPTSASRLPLSRFGQPGSIPAFVLSSVAWQLGTKRVLQLNDINGVSPLDNIPNPRHEMPQWLDHEFTDPKVSGLNLDFYCLNFANLAVFRPSWFILVAWQLGI
ncbi:hypothetical protein T265_07860 [Opisthorchis viverrini]|uniref:Uncharacterized protein n=1 Tax=Opisthorchis viverrini TaxID=6198 RepID=A0A074ZM94_OPIVI|nr:hypothetical protein T265_07860 [Opisthorchis viverrini]KER24495.1 hypothetical protein T265_07860 [Opisthorchis viverrini]